VRDPGGALNPRFHHRRARGSGRARSLVLLPFLLLALAAGCAPEAEPPSDPELREALGLDDTRVIHRITLGGRGSIEHVTPRRLEIEPGDIVQFAPVDRRVHTVVFGGAGLSADGAAFLDRTHQRASPPLMDIESRFVVHFENAPAGEYPFASTAHGEPVSGMIVVRSSQDDAR
jgi:plastocyanin